MSKNVPTAATEHVSIDNIPTGNVELLIRRHEMPNKILVSRYWNGMEKPEQLAYVPERTCNADETDVIKCWIKCKDEPSTEHMELVHVMECSECGHTYEHVNGDYEFCPRCGRKRVDE